MPLVLMRSRLGNDMFKRIQQGMNIEKAFALCEEEMNIPLKKYFNQLPFPERASIRETLKQLQSEMAMGLQDIALFLVASFVTILSPEERVQATGRAWWWNSAELLHKDVYRYFLVEMNK